MKILRSGQIEKRRKPRAQADSLPWQSRATASHAARAIFLIGSPTSSAPTVGMRVHQVGLLHWNGC